MAEPGLLGWDPGSRILRGSVLLTTARQTLGLSILSSCEWGCDGGTPCALRLTRTHSPTQSQTWAATVQCVHDVMRSIQEDGGRWGGVERRRTSRKGGGVGWGCGDQGLKESSGVQHYF